MNLENNWHHCEMQVHGTNFFTPKCCPFLKFCIFLVDKGFDRAFLKFHPLEPIFLCNSHWLSLSSQLHSLSVAKRIKLQYYKFIMQQYLNNPALFSRELIGNTMSSQGRREQEFWLFNTIFCNCLVSFTLTITDATLVHKSLINWYIIALKKKKKEKKKWDGFM